jgi:hypothetical protein
MTDEKKTTQVTEAPAMPATEADLIWNEIKNKDIMMFSLPGQKVADYCRPMPVDPARCFLLYKAGSVVPAIENAIGDKFECLTADKYIIVSRKKPNAF